MKTKFLSFLAACLLAGTVLADNLSGNIQGVESGAVIVCSYDPANGQALMRDTVVLQNGAFSITVPDRLMQIHVIAKPKDPAAAAMMMSPRNAFLFLPGDHLRLNGPVTALKPSGTRLYKELDACGAWKKLHAKSDSLLRIINTCYQDKEKNQAILSRLMGQLKEVYAEQKKVCKEIVMQQPGSLAAAYLVTLQPLNDAVPLIPLLQPEVQNGAFRPVFDRMKSDYEQARKREEAQKTLVAGKKAPDFRLRDLKGQERTLADFQGKYVLLDFWGTWCGWCIKGIPQMKEYYQKYKDRMEIVGICCNDTENAWRNGVTKHGLPWTNLYNGYEKEVTTRYAVSGFPTKVLIDPNGNLVQIFVGESEELYQKLDKLFTNQ